MIHVISETRPNEINKYLNNPYDLYLIGQGDITGLEDLFYQTFPTGFGVVNINNALIIGNEFANRFGFIVPPEYLGYCWDYELSTIADAIGVYKVLELKPSPPVSRPFISAQDDPIYQNDYLTLPIVVNSINRGWYRGKTLLSWFVGYPTEQRTDELTACLIVKNEQDHIETVINSLIGGQGDNSLTKIVILDTGSTDDTEKILVEKYGAEVVRYDQDSPNNQDNTGQPFITFYTGYQWEDSFSIARNLALSKCTTDWVLSIDADEILEVNGIAKLKKFIKTANNSLINSINVNLVAGTNSHVYPRCFFRHGARWYSHGHEIIVTMGQSLPSDVKITYGSSTAHSSDPDRMLRIMLKTVTEDPCPRAYFYLAREYQYRKDYPKAIDYYQLCLKQSVSIPERAEASLQLAYCYWYSNQGELARQSAANALMLNSNFGEAAYLMGTMSFKHNATQWFKMANNANNQGLLFYRDYPRIGT